MCKTSSNFAPLEWSPQFQVTQLRNLGNWKEHAMCTFLVRRRKLKINQDRKRCIKRSLALLQASRRSGESGLVAGAHLQQDQDQDQDQPRLAAGRRSTGLGWLPCWIIEDFTYLQCSPAGIELASLNTFNCSIYVFSCTTVNPVEKCLPCTGTSCWKFSWVSWHFKSVITWAVIVLFICLKYDGLSEN